jgi:Predicted transcriptional regulator
MKITSRFTVAVHTLLCIYKFGDEYKVTSEFIASSVNVNPVIIRRTLGQLQAAGLVETARGSGGSALARSLGGITLLDVYNAVESVEGDLFNFHDNPNAACPVGRNVHRILDGHLADAQKALEASLKKVKLSELSADLEGALRAGD